MMSKVTRGFLLITSLTVSLHAETLRLSLPDAVSMALREGTVARLARSQEERASIAQREALSGLLPQSEARLMRYNESVNLATFGFSLPGLPPVIGPFDVVDAQVTATMQLFNLAALRYYQASRAGAEASRFHFQQAQNDVTVMVSRLYVLAQRADAQVVAREANVALFKELARVAEDEFKAGTGTRLDVAQANVQLSRAQEALLRAQNDRQSARLGLLNAIGADQSSELVLADPLGASPAPPAVDAALTSAREQRPELKELQAAEKQAELTLSSAKARRVPRVELSFLGDYAGFDTDHLHSSRRIAGAVAMPIFRGDISANIARARLELEDVRTRNSSVERDVEQQVRTSLLSLENAQARVTVATETAKVAEEALTIARERKVAGYGSSVEVDRAEDIYRQAHEDAITARADAALAWYDLQHATGTIGALAPPAPSTVPPAPETTIP
ncbi:MAG: putative Outer rane efflux protein [Acidobacteria bacterium]|nr:putative Outer rane efflux protein [Acidobacteriota bacterium]